MVKIEFCDYEDKSKDEILCKKTVAYVNVTSKVKTLMDNVDKAYLVVDDDFIVEKYGYSEAEAKEELQRATIIPEDGIALKGKEELIVRFLSGKTINFHVCEWGHLGKDGYNFFKNQKHE